MVWHGIMKYQVAAIIFGLMVISLNLAAASSGDISDLKSQMGFLAGQDKDNATATQENMTLVKQCDIYLNQSLAPDTMIPQWLVSVAIPDELWAPKVIREWNGNEAWGGTWLMP